MTEPKQILELQILNLWQLLLKFTGQKGHKAKQTLLWDTYSKTQFVTESQKTKNIVLYYKWGMGENSLRAMWYLQSSYTLCEELFFLFHCI